MMVERSLAMQIVYFISNTDARLKDVAEEFDVERGYNDWGIFYFILENTGMTISEIKKGVGDKWKGSD